MHIRVSLIAYLYLAQSDLSVRLKGEREKMDEVRELSSTDWRIRAARQTVTTRLTNHSHLSLFGHQGVTHYITRSA